MTPLADEERQRIAEEERVRESVRREFRAGKANFLTDEERQRTAEEERVRESARSEFRAGKASFPGMVAAAIAGVSLGMALTLLLGVAGHPEGIVSLVTLTVVFLYLALRS